MNEATRPSRPIDVLFVQQGRYLVALAANHVAEVLAPEDDEGNSADSRRIPLESLLRLPRREAPARESAVRHRLRVETGAAPIELEVAGRLHYGSLAPERLIPIPPFLAGLRRTTGIESIFRDSQDCIGFLFDPAFLRESPSPERGSS